MTRWLCSFAWCCHPMVAAMRPLSWAHQRITAEGWPEVPNLIMTDNQRMMRWIVDGWVTKMPTFVGKPGLEAMTWLDCDSGRKAPGDLKTRYSETLRGSGVTLQ